LSIVPGKLRFANDNFEADFFKLNTTRDQNSGERMVCSSARTHLALLREITRTFHSEK
jgi:hypothetical protein